jgi:dual specificity phosphatase 3
MPEVEYLWNGIDDIGQQVPFAWFGETAMWAAEAIRNGDKVLTHYHMGVNRGPRAGFAVLLAMGWDPIEAMPAIHTARPIAHIAYAEDPLQ